ncbi:TPA: hypothetical protein ACH3X1_006582 [Trebouxia sp. C0004]
MHVMDMKIFSPVKVFHSCEMCCSIRQSLVHDYRASMCEVASQNKYSSLNLTMPVIERSQDSPKRPRHGSSPASSQHTRCCAHTHLLHMGKHVSWHSKIGH